MAVVQMKTQVGTSAIIVDKQYVGNFLYAKDKWM